MCTHTQTSWIVKPHSFYCPLYWKSWIAIRDWHSSKIVVLIDKPAYCSGRPRFDTRPLSSVLLLSSMYERRRDGAVSVMTALLVACLRFCREVSVVSEMFVLALGPTEPLVQGYSGLVCRGLWSWSLIPFYCRSSWMEIYRHFSVYLYGLHRDKCVLFYLSGTFG